MWNAVFRFVRRSMSRDKRARLRTSPESFSARQLRLLGLIDLAAVGQQERQPRIRLFLQKVSTAPTSSVIWSGSAWSMSWMVCSITFLGIF